MGDDCLAILGKLSRLEVVLLRNTRVTDHGLVHLSGLAELDTLDLRATGVRGPGLRHLAGLESLYEVRLGWWRRWTARRVVREAIPHLRLV